MSVALETAPSAIDELIEKIRRYDPEGDVEAVRRAYEFAAGAHEGQQRDSGTPYIEHPLQVARTLADLQMDTATICAAFLHDVVEDTSVELAEIETRFGAEVARLVDGVTKLSQAEFENWEMGERRPSASGAQPAAKEATVIADGRPA